MADPQDWLKVQLGSQEKAVDAEAFLGVFQNTVDALKALDRTLSTHGAETIQWQIVSAGSNSPIFATIRGEGRRARNGKCSEEVIGAFVSGLEQLRKENSCPPHFNQDSLGYVKQIVASAVHHGLRPRFSTATRHVLVKKVIASNADWAMKTLSLGKSRYTEFGTLEGYLRELSGARTRDKLVIVDRLTNQSTPCYLGRPELEAIAREAWKHRVSITGEITVDRQTGQPIKIAVADIRVLRDRKDLPQIENLHGIDITNGVEASEYVRGLRDAA